MPKGSHPPLAISISGKGNKVYVINPANGKSSGNNLISCPYGADQICADDLFDFNIDNYC